MHKLGVVVLLGFLGGLGACVDPIVEVTTLHPTPRHIASRTLDSVKLFKELPENSVAVFGLVATNGSRAELQNAVYHKAANLGCDGVVIADYSAARQIRREVATGGLNEQRELAEARILALCVVLKESSAGR